MAEWTQEMQEKVVKTVSERSLNDVQFRKELVSHPHRAIQEATGAIVPDTVRLQFVDQGAAHLTIVLPPMAVSEDELSEQQLETVAGGKGLSGQQWSPIDNLPLMPPQNQGPGVVIMPANPIFMPLSKG